MDDPPVSLVHFHFQLLSLSFTLLSNRIIALLAVTQVGHLSEIT